MFIDSTYRLRGGCVRPVWALTNGVQDPCRSTCPVRSDEVKRLADGKGSAARLCLKEARAQRCEGGAENRNPDGSRGTHLPGSPTVRFTGRLGPQFVSLRVMTA